MIILSSEDGYRLDIDRRGFYLNRNTTLICPACGSRFERFGRRRRVFVGASGRRYYATIQRLRCTGADCHKVHHVLPEGILPYKRYRSDCVETAVTDANSCVGADVSTISRWKSWLRDLLPLLESMLQTLSETSRKILRLRIPLQPIHSQPRRWLARTVKYAVQHTWRWINPKRLEKTPLH